MSDPQDDDELEVIDQDGRFVLTLSLEGHEIWDLDAASGADPIETYPAGESGSEQAWQRYRQLVKQDRWSGRVVRGLRNAAIVAEIAWMTAGLVTSALYYRALSTQGGSNSSLIGLGSLSNLQRFQILSQALYYVALGLLAILITIWVGRRLTSPAPVRPLRRPISPGRESDPGGP